MDRLASFERFSDEPGSPFYRAHGRTPEATWHEIVRCQVAVLATIVEQTEAGPLAVAPRLISEWHRGVFGTTFPEDAGRFRGQLTDGSWEHVTFGITVGTSLTSRVRPMRGSHPTRIYENLQRACNEFNGFTETLRRGDLVPTIRLATTECARLYADPDHPPIR